MLQPKKTKFRKQQKGRMKGMAHRGHQLAKSQLLRRLRQENRLNPGGGGCSES